MALVGIELEILVSEPDAPTNRPSPCATVAFSVLLGFYTLVLQLLHVSTAAPYLIVELQKYCRRSMLELV